VHLQEIPFGQVDAVSAAIEDGVPGLAAAPGGGDVAGGGGDHRLGGHGPQIRPTAGPVDGNLEDEAALGRRGRRWSVPVRAVEGAAEGGGLGQPAADGDEKEADVTGQCRTAPGGGRRAGHRLISRQGGPVVRRRLLEFVPAPGDQQFGLPGVQVHDVSIGVFIDIFKNIAI